MLHLFPRQTIKLTMDSTLQCRQPFLLWSSMVKEAHRNFRPALAIWLLYLLLPVALRTARYSMTALYNCAPWHLRCYCHAIYARGNAVDICPFCLNTIWISFLYLENIPPSRALFPQINGEYHSFPGWILKTTSLTGHRVLKVFLDCDLLETGHVLFS